MREQRARVVLEVDVTGTANKNNTSTQNRISGTHHDKKDRGLSHPANHDGYIRAKKTTRIYQENRDNRNEYITYYNSNQEEKERKEKENEKNNNKKQTNKTKQQQQKRIILYVVTI